jgi:hypothetical protein
MSGQRASNFVGAIVWVLACGLAMSVGCSSSTSTNTTGSDGNGGAAPSSTHATGGAGTSSTTTAGGGGSTGGATSGGAAGTAGAGQGGSVPPADGGSGCNGETPAATASCGAGKSCHLASCGPPAQFACVQAGMVAQGGACMTNTDCAVGMNCIGYSATLRACEKQCTSDAECPNSRCAEYSTCNMALRGKFCLRPCSDVTAAGAAACGAGFKCDGLCVGGMGATVCVAAGTAKSGACTNNTDCAPGYTCINLSTDGGVAASCTQLCNTTPDCAAGMCTGNIGCGTMATNLHFCQ